MSLFCYVLQSLFLGSMVNHQVTLPTQGGAEGLLLTKNSSVAAVARYAVSRLNGSRGPGRQFARYFTKPSAEHSAHMTKCKQ